MNSTVWYLTCKRTYNMTVYIKLSNKMTAPVITYDCDWFILTSVEKSNKHHMITYL